MARKLPPLNALKAFEAAARLSSFSRAAAELNVTHAAISRHVRALEAEFRTPLFERTGRGVELTEAGRSLAQELTRGFDLIAAASSRFAHPSRRRRRLIVTSDVSFAALWLAPRLGKFTSLQVSTSSSIQVTGLSNSARRMSISASDTVLASGTASTRENLSTLN
jgi:LysR family glycine cleavage system transcriptional activator